MGQVDKGEPPLKKTKFTNSPPPVPEPDPFDEFLKSLPQRNEGATAKAAASSPSSEHGNSNRGLASPLPTNSSSSSSSVLTQSASPASTSSVSKTLHFNDKTPSSKGSAPETQRVSPIKELRHLITVAIASGTSRI